ncbi:MAG: hypothetical protein M3428_02120 [Pseudomonadota bacterium]|nr:hypothetical protein [Pseudomonadota bacterium]
MRKIGFLASSALALLASSPAGAEEYTFLISDRPSGTMQVTQQGQERSVAFSFNDRGRGVDLKQVSKFGPGGTIRSTSIKGVDYLKVPLEDTFGVEGGKASWKSRVDAGSSSASQAFYIPYLSPPAHWAALVRALLAAPGQSLDLLPAGRATLRKHSDIEVSGTDGIKETAILYTIVGPELGPKPVWLDSKGELFFNGSSWNGTIRKGFEKAAPTLVAEQGKALSAAELAAAKTLGRRPSAVLIRNANLFDSKSKSMRPGTSVLLRGKRIEAVGPDGSIAARASPWPAS